MVWSQTLTPHTPAFVTYIETHLFSLGLTQKCYQHVMTSYLFGLAHSVRYMVDRTQTIFSDIASHLRIFRNYRVAICTLPFNIPLVMVSVNSFQIMIRFCYLSQKTVSPKFYAICGNKMPTRCNRWYLLQILLLAQHVSGTIMPIIRSSRVLYKWLLPVVFGALVFKLSVWCGAEGYVSGLRAAINICCI